MLASVSTGFFPNSTSPPLSAVLTKFNNVDNISQFQSNFTISTKFQIFYQGFQENDNVENTDNADNTDKLLNTDILDNKDFSTIKTLIRVIPNFCYFFFTFSPYIEGLSINDSRRWPNDPSRNPATALNCRENWAGLLCPPCLRRFQQTRFRRPS